jgi:hypothetical protein
MLIPERFLKTCSPWNGAEFDPAKAAKMPMVQAFQAPCPRDVKEALGSALAAPISRCACSFSVLCRVPIVGLAR